ATRLVGERLADDSARQVDRELAQLGPQLSDESLPLRGELLLAGRDDAIRLLPGFGEDALADPLRIRTSVVADPSRLGTRLGELGLVLLKQLVRLSLRGFGPLDTAFDRLDPRLVHRLHPRHDEPQQDEDEQGEGDRPDNPLLPDRQERAVLGRFGGDGHLEPPGSRADDQPPTAKASTRPYSA